MSIFLGLLITPLLNRSGALFGRFSGKYIAVTFQPAKTDRFLLEIVTCHHVGNKVFGRIEGVCFAQQKGDDLVALDNNKGKYKFEGFVDERLFVISYSTTIRGAKGAGTLTLQGDGSGTVFDGVWGGYDEGKVIGTRCIWFLYRGRLDPKNDKNLLIESARKALNLYYFQFDAVGNSAKSTSSVSPDSPSVSISQSKNTGLYFLGRGGVGKTRLLEDVLQNPQNKEHPKTIGLSDKIADNFSSTQSTVFKDYQDSKKLLDKALEQQEKQGKNLHRPTAVHKFPKKNQKIPKKR